MEFRIVDAWGGMKGKRGIVGWVVNCPRQSEVPSFGRRVGLDCL
jgi:hypothetical protein